jgi:hypothetical protein
LLKSVAMRICVSAITSASSDVMSTFRAALH